MDKSTQTDAPTNVEYTFNHVETPESIRFDHAIINDRYKELESLRERNQNDCMQTTVIFTAWRLGRVIIKEWWPRHVKHREIAIRKKCIVLPEAEHRIWVNWVYDKSENDLNFECCKNCHFEFARKVAVPELFNIKTLGLSKTFLKKNYFYLGNFHYNQ